MDKNSLLLKKIINLALEEDIGAGDLTSEGLLPSRIEGKGVIIAKEKGVIAGLPVAEAVFNILSPELSWTPLAKEGDEVASGQEIAQINGDLRYILTGERTALNFLQRLSGIATKTRQMVSLIKDLPVSLVDTRKTTPGHRVLEKYAVKVGGGQNHRLGLFDAYLIKENHITAAGGIREALRLAKKSRPLTAKIEIEVKDIVELVEALDEGVDIIMLDNMSLEEMKQGVEINKGRALLEASGGITEDNLVDVAKTGIDVISVGALTHSVKSLDLSLLV